MFSVKETVYTLIMLVLVIPFAAFAEIAPPETRTTNIDNNMVLTFSTDTLMVLETTGNTDLERAIIDFSVGFSGTAAGDSITGMDIFFDLSDLVYGWTLDTAYSVNWGNGTFQLNDLGDGAYSMAFDNDSVVASGTTVFAKLEFTVTCIEEGSIDTLLFDTMSSEVSLDGIDHKPPIDCDSCWVDGEVVVADYRNKLYTLDPIIYDGYGKEIVVPVYVQNNFRLWGLFAYISYDETRLEFLGMDDFHETFWDYCYQSTCPDSLDNPIAIQLHQGPNNYQGILTEGQDNKVFGLRFKVLQDTIWDGTSTSITFSDTNKVYAFGGYTYCSKLTEGPAWPAEYTFIDGMVTLKKYEAEFAYEFDAETFYVGSSSPEVSYNLSLKNSFEAGMPSNSAAYEGNISIMVQAHTDFTMNEYDSADTEEALLFAKGEEGDTIINLFQKWSTLADSSHWSYFDDYDNTSTVDIITGHFDWNGDTPDEYLLGRYLPVFHFEDELQIISTTYYAQVSTTKLDGSSDPLVVADVANGRLTIPPSTVVFEVPMGEFYTSSGGGMLFSRDLDMRNNFTVDTFSVTIEVTTNDFQIDTIIPEAGVSVTEVVANKKYTIFSGENRVPSGDSLMKIASIDYRSLTTPPCGQTYRDTLIFTNCFMTDAGIGGHDRYLDIPADGDVILSRSGGGCPVSCPVLYAYDGTGYVEQNPLLTACEASNYQSIVTDYYLVPEVGVDQEGRVNFQLRELEDEITTLDEISLITVDHEPESQVAAALDGDIHVYLSSSLPATAIDHRGNDVLAQVIVNDRVFYQSSEPGYIIVQFPKNAGRGTGITTATGPKPACRAMDKLATEGDLELNQVAVEMLNVDGEWVLVSGELPLRVNPISEMVPFDMEGLDLTEGITTRISWTRFYATDAINLIVPSEEMPIIEHWSLDDNEVSRADGVAKTWAGGAGNPLTLRLGEQLSFSFAPSKVPDGLVRDYIIVATGKYEPDYSVFTDMIPHRYQLYDAYPNPFNPSTTISYDLPSAGQVQLDIFNLLGQKVITLVDDYQTAGHQTTIWEGRNSNGEKVASGVYFYRLTTEAYTDSRKMIMLK